MMKRRGKRSGGLLLQVLALSAGTAVFAQPQPQRPSPDGTGERWSVTLRGEEVPVAIRVRSVLRAIGFIQRKQQQDGGNWTHTYLVRLNLVDPDSEGARELLEISLAFVEAEDLSDEEFQVALADLWESGEMNERSLAAVQAARQNQSLRRAGEALGSWLRSRELEGLEIGPLLERFLDNASVSVSVSGTASESPFSYQDFAEEVGAFERGMKSTMGRLPRAVRRSVGRGSVE